MTGAKNAAFLKLVLLQQDIVNMNVLILTLNNLHIFCTKIHFYISCKVRYVDLYSALDDKYLVLKALRHGSHSLTYNAMPAFNLRSRSPDATGVVTTSSCSLVLFYQPQKDERLNWPSWLAYSGWFTHISGHPSAVS